MRADSDFVDVMFPASAGMIPLRLLRLRHLIDVPRKRGDDPETYLEQLVRRVCSPQARG